MTQNINETPSPACVVLGQRSCHGCLYAADPADYDAACLLLSAPVDGFPARRMLVRRDRYKAVMEAAKEAVALSILGTIEAAKQ